MPSTQSGSSVARSATRVRTHSACSPTAWRAWSKIKSCVPYELQPSAPLDDAKAVVAVVMTNETATHEMTHIPVTTSSSGLSCPGDHPAHLHEPLIEERQIPWAD